MLPLVVKAARMFNSSIFLFLSHLLTSFSRNLHEIFFGFWIRLEPLGPHRGLGNLGRALLSQFWPDSGGIRPFYGQFRKQPPKKNIIPNDGLAISPRPHAASHDHHPRQPLNQKLLPRRLLDVHA